ARIAAPAVPLDLWMFEKLALKRILSTDLRHSDVFQLCGLPRLATWITESLGKPAFVRWPGPPGSALPPWLGRYAGNIANGDALKALSAQDSAAIQIPIGVNSERFRPGKSRIARSELGLSESDVVVTF